MSCAATKSDLGVDGREVLGRTSTAKSESALAGKQRKAASAAALCRGHGAPAGREGPQLAELTEQVSKLTANSAAHASAATAAAARVGAAEQRAARGRAPADVGDDAAVPGASDGGQRRRRAAPGQPHFFHASMRGGLTAAGARGLTSASANPYRTCTGRRSTAAASARRRAVGELSEPGGSLRRTCRRSTTTHSTTRSYWPFKGWAYPPSDYTGPDDARETDDLSKMPSLALQFVYGYAGRRVRQNLFYNADKKVVYHTAALGVVYDKERHEQLFFLGHDDDVTALDLHPNGVTVCSGQVGKGRSSCGRQPRRPGRPPAALRDPGRPQARDRRPPSRRPASARSPRARARARPSRPRAPTTPPPQVLRRWGRTTTARSRCTSGRPTRRARGGDADRDGQGHNDDILDFNPATDHVVGVGKKYIRFFGVKEGVEEKASESRDAKLSKHESALWAKKGVFGKRGKQQDMMCVAFGNDGIRTPAPATSTASPSRRWTSPSPPTTTAR